MSQAKVDHNKDLKKNRKKIDRKEKVVRGIQYAAVIVVIVGILGWFGYSVYNSATRDDDEEQVVRTINIDEYNEYESGLTLSYDA